jgi:hypothetical protein
MNFAAVDHLGDEADPKIDVVLALGSGAKFAGRVSSANRSDTGECLRNAGNTRSPSHRVDKREHHLSNGVAAITPGVNDMAGQNIAELQQLKKFVKKVDTAKMRQARMITGDLKVSRRSSHSEPYLTKSEVRLRVAKMREIPINSGSEALLEPKNAPDQGIRARL